MLNGLLSLVLLFSAAAQADRQPTSYGGYPPKNLRSEYTAHCDGRSFSAVFETDRDKTVLAEISRTPIGVNAAMQKKIADEVQQYRYLAGIKILCGTFSDVTTGAFVVMQIKGELIDDGDMQNKCSKSGGHLVKDSLERRLLIDTDHVYAIEGDFGTCLPIEAPPSSEALEETPQEDPHQ